MRKFNYEIGLDFIPPEFIYPGEIFRYVTDDIVPGVYPYYMVSNFGKVYHRYLKIIMKPGLETSGYYFIILSTINGQKIVQMNRLVLMTFNPINNPENYQANHINGNKLNNELSNLEWTTRSENITHAYKTGLHPKPSNTIIDIETAKKIVCMLDMGKKCKDIAYILDVNENIVNSIKKKESWKEVSEGHDFNYRKGRKYSDEEVIKLCEYFENNKKFDNEEVNSYVLKSLIACGFDNPEEYIDTARKIYTRKYYTNISNNYNF